MRRRYSLLSIAVAAVVLAASPAGSASAAEPKPFPQPIATVPSVKEGNDPVVEEDDPVDWETPEYPEQGEGPDEPTDDMFEDSEETTAGADTAGQVKTMADPDCKGEWGLKKVTKKTMRNGRVGPRISSYFADGGEQTLKAGITGTLKVSASMKIAGKLSALTLGEISAEVNGTVEGSLALDASVQNKVNVPKKKYGNGYWGAQRVVVNVKSFWLEKRTCKLKPLKEFTFYAPARNLTVGWCNWSSKKSWGSRPRQCNDGSGFVLT